MIKYTVVYNPDLSKSLVEEIAFAFSPSLVSADREEPTGVFSLDMVVELLDKGLLVTATEEDVKVLNSLADNHVSYVELHL